jgi:hypothetical protein
MQQRPILDGKDLAILHHPYRTSQNRTGAIPSANVKADRPPRRAAYLPY